MERRIKINSKNIPHLFWSFSLDMILAKQYLTHKNQQTTHDQISQLVRNLIKKLFHTHISASSIKSRGKKVRKIINDRTMQAPIQSNQLSPKLEYLVLTLLNTECSWYKISKAIKQDEGLPIRLKSNELLSYYYWHLRHK